MRCALQLKIAKEKLTVELCGSSRRNVLLEKGCGLAKSSPEADAFSLLDAQERRARATEWVYILHKEEDVDVTHFPLAKSLFQVAQISD
jgi:hypothetical protein